MEWVDLLRWLGSIGASVTKPIPLMGFLVACTSIIYLVYNWMVTERIKSLPKHERTQVVDDSLRRYDLKLTDLSTHEKTSLVRGEMREQTRRRLHFLALAGAIVGGVVFIASLVILREEPPKTVPVPGPEERVSDPNERVLEFKAQILILRGDIEDKDRAQDADLRQRALTLANQIGGIDESQLRPAIKIIQHEYRGWAFLMAVSTFTKTSPENIAAASRTAYAIRAIEEFDKAIDFMAGVKRDYKANVPAAIPVYEWMTGPSQDLNRTHYLKAIALAVIARAGGGTPQAAIAELSAIEPPYLEKFPAKNNPDLEWALEPSGPSIEPTPAATVL